MKIDSTRPPDAHQSPTSTDRRSFLAAAPALAVLTAGPALAGAPSTHDPAFAECVATYQRAEAVRAQHQKTFVEPAEEALRVAREAVPHLTTEASIEVSGGEQVHFSTADRMHCAIAREWGKTFHGGDSGVCATELLSLINKREVQLAALPEEHRLDEHYDEQDRLADIAWQAFHAIDTYPVRSAGDLLRKIEFMESEGYPETQIDTLLADLRRIA